MNILFSILILKYKSIAQNEKNSNTITIVDLIMDFSFSVNDLIND